MKVIAAWAALILLAAQAHGAPADKSADERLLEKHSVASTDNGIVAYLNKLKAGPDEWKRAEALVAQLDDLSFTVRQAATRELTELPNVPIALLREAAASANSELAARAKMILDHPRTAAKLDAARGQRVLTAAVLRTASQRKVHGIAPLLIELAPRLDEEGLAMLAGDAVAKAAAADEALVQSSVAAPSPIVKAVAIRGLVKAVGRDEAIPMLTEFSRDENPRVALAAAQALAEQGELASLEVLVKLITVEDENLRVRAVQLLRSATKQSFGENPYLEPDKQKAESAKWQAWLAKNGDAKIHLPLELASLPEDLGVGLIRHYTFDDDAKGRVIDHSGKEQHGDLKNAVEYVTRGEGKALKIVGEGHHGAAGGHATMPFIDFASLKEFSLSLWVRETAMSHAEGEAYVTFGVDRGSNTQDSLGIAHLNASLLFRVGEGEVSVPFAAKDVDRWVHYAMTFRDGRLTGYKDGKEVGAAAAKVQIPARRAALGRHWWANGAGTSTRFQGALDDLRIYDRVLDAGQIELLMEMTR